MDGESGGAAPRRASRGWVAYWTLVIVLMGFGLVDLLGIGFPFLLIGFTLALLWPVRIRPEVFWPVLLGVIAFIVGYALFAPLACRSESVVAVSAARTSTQAGTTRCTNLLGIDYSGSLAYDPPLWPGFLAGALFAAATAYAMRRAILRRGADARASGSTR